MRVILGVLLAALAACTAAPAESPLDTLVPAILEQDRIPGAVVLAGDLEKTSYRKAFGTARLDTIFDLASCTKVVGTTTAAMLLVEQGKLSLDDPLGKYVPCFRGRDITVRELLQHRSGLPAYMTPRTSSPDEILGEFAAFKPGRKALQYS